MATLTEYGLSVLPDIIDIVNSDIDMYKKHDLFESHNVVLYSQGTTRCIFTNHYGKKNKILTDDALLKIDHSCDYPTERERELPHNMQPSISSSANKNEIVNYKYFGENNDDIFLEISDYDKKHGLWIVMPRALGIPTPNNLNTFLEVFHERGFSSDLYDIHVDNVGFHHGMLKLYDYSLALYDYTLEEPFISDYNEAWKTISKN